MTRIATIGAAVLVVSSVTSFADQAKPAAPAAGAQQPAPTLAVGMTVPADYVIGAGDVLMINYWKEPDMTVESTVVRPDGMITVPLLKDVQAMGLKPDQLASRLEEMSAKQAGLNEPRVTVGVREIRSRKVYIQGGVAKPGAYDLLTPMTVLQLISIAGGLREFEDGSDITIIREEGGKQTALNFNLKEVQRGKRLEQNIQLKPGDSVNVPE